MGRTGLALFGLACIIAISAYLRFHNLEVNPGWDGDEGYNINIAWNLSQGRFQMYALSYTFVQHPPLFFATLVPVFGVFGANILALRLLTSFCGVLTTLLLFFAAKDIAGLRVAVLSSALFAIYPVAVVFNRLGYSYNQLMLFAVLCFYLAWRFLIKKDERSGPIWAAGAGLAAGLGSITDQEGVFLVAFVVTLVALVRRKHLPVAVASALFLPLSYVGMMLATVPGDFVYDLQHNFGRVSGNGPLVESLMFAFSYERFLDYSYWLPLGIVGLFLLRDRRAKLYTIAFFFLMLLFILKIRNPNPFFRTAVPVLPFIALGIGLLIDTAIIHLFEWGDEIWRQTLGSRWLRLQSVATTSVVFALIFLPLAVQTATDVFGVQTRLRSSIDDFLADSPRDAVLVADFVNSRVRSDDVVIASSNVSWLFRARTADVLQAVVAEGKGTAFYPAVLPKNRFRYDAAPEAARFVVIDDISRIWIREMPEERAIIEMVTSSWRRVYEAGEYQVFENPSMG